ncbi:diaminopimelate decarboxylase [Gulosibacter bifidus]|uniref:Diaminopimelate decarboxylase n=1 Tax=Gulosibacter bifidus TaxID=272239 RepID=A0ABW5RHB6_9MICO|nr:diaminopimelate decarboxylase [Gulosibacter bifidus]
MGMAQRRASAISEIAAMGLIDDEQPLVGIVDLDTIQERVQELNHAFSGTSKTLHTIATKSATLIPLLKVLHGTGLGCEVASPGELAMAQAAGFQPQQMVFDSPAKTIAELRNALQLGIAINVDNFQELERLDELTAEYSPKARIGFRINPQSGAGRIGPMSTATSTSKFGVGIEDAGMYSQIVEAYVQRPWLTQLHVHSGSQGISLEQMAQGIKKLVELADAIDEACGRPRITHIDIGGGLPVNFDGDEVSPNFYEYRTVLDHVVPDLFDGRRTIVTEFGRAILAKSGCLISRVEYTKTTGGRPIAISHVGAQIATRTVFMPESWPLRVSAHDPTGALKTDQVITQDIGGPCCFAGDMIARERSLPRLKQGDLIAVHDTGAYYFSNHYSYNALPRPAVLMHSLAGDALQWRTLRTPETLEQLLHAAGAAQ